jgi:hypothetical protein
MGRKGNNKKKPGTNKSKPETGGGGGGNSISSLVHGKDNQPARIGDVEKPSSPTKKGKK